MKKTVTARRAKPADAISFPGRDCIWEQILHILLGMTSRRGQNNVITDPVTESDPVYEKMQAMESFMARRFDELSAEINATSQMVGMAEESIAGRFGEILSVLGAVSQSEEGLTAANSGYELDAVVHETELATNCIMDAAERIAESLQTNPQVWEDEAAREKLLQGIKDDVQAILLSCSFQDLTGQRIEKAVQNIREAENRLQGILRELGFQADTVQSLSRDLKQGQARSQNEIDELFER